MRSTLTSTAALARPSVSRRRHLLYLDDTNTRGEAVRHRSDRRQPIPVYARTKAAGSSKFTIVKKIEGNKKAFARTSPGFHVDKVKEWLGNTLGNSAAAKTSTTSTTA
ncbi:mitochondrial large ribosomal subunit [Colletotrichum tofieldiae]|nr:mitochondrial large ribosomal subunit [Colletotrichum tofieldiae]